MNRILFLPVLAATLIVTDATKHCAEDIVGRWMSIENNLEVEVFKSGNEYKARLIWFDDSDDKMMPLNARFDRKNPNAALRNRKIVGLEIMNGLVYNARDEQWKKGQIYDPRSGRIWNAEAWLTKEGCLKVRAFWHFEFLGQDMCFKKSN